MDVAVLEGVTRCACGGDHAPPQLLPDRMTATTGCTVDGCPCMERGGLLAEIDALTELEIQRDPWPIAATILGFANTVLLAALILAK